MSAVLKEWRAGPPNPLLDEKLNRLCASEDVVHVAVMPDAHVADDVCIGTVTATTARLIPAAVGSDIGCGVISVCLHSEAGKLRDAGLAGRILHGLGRVVPPLVHAARAAPSMPLELEQSLSSAALEALRTRDGRLQFGTLGRGNHFLELQRDEQDVLWLAVHSGSRSMGQTIRRHHEGLAERDGNGLAWLDAEAAEGRAYLHDADWAVRYATLSRRHMLTRACEVLSDQLATSVQLEEVIGGDHNHVRCECHAGRTLWVHRKGAQRVDADVLAVVPGSMGSPSFHVVGRGEPAALCSAAHGAGRALARGDARRRIRARDLDQQMQGVWFDARLRDGLREEAPSAYKDIGQVMRAQHELVRIVRKLEPVLVYKAV